MPSLLYAAVFGAGTGLLLSAALSFLPLRIRGVLSLFLSFLISACFTIESVVRSAFHIYFSPGSLAAEAANVFSQYTEEFGAGAGSGFARVLLFALPVVFVLARKMICMIRKTRPADRAAALPPESKELCGEGIWIQHLSWAALLLSVASIAAFHGEASDIFTARYHFNDAVQEFGLSEALQLEGRYGIFGNPYSGFYMSAGAGNAGGRGQETGEGSIATPGDMPEDGSMQKQAAADGTDPQAAAVAAGTTGAAGTDTSAMPFEPVYGENIMDIDFSRPELQGKTADLSAYLSVQVPSGQNEYTGIFRGKNLILICAESYCDAFIRPELTPTLWRLSHEGFYFSDFYQPSWGGSTTTGELSMVEGLAGVAGSESITNIANHNHYFTMGNQLQRLGYFSLAFHNGSHTFYHRNQTHRQLGYDAFFASGQHLDAFCGHSYPSDTEMFEGTLPLYMQREPFSVYYMTVSGHAPYEKGSPFVKKYYDRVNEAVGDEYYEKTKYYICYQMELENALTRMLEMLEEAGIADDTVIVMTGDHYPYGLGNGKTWHNDRDYIDDLMKTDDVLYWNEDKSGLVIWSGALEHDPALRELVCEISDPVSSLDILPTVSNLFGVEYDSRLLPGRDVFSDTEPLVYWNNRSWITKAGKYDSRKRKFYPAEMPEPEEAESSEQEEAKTLEQAETESGEQDGTETGEQAETEHPEHEEAELPEQRETEENETGNRKKNPEAGTLPVPDENYIEEIHHLVADRLQMNASLLKYDYYGLLFGPDEVTGDQDEVWEMLRKELEKSLQNEAESGLQDSGSAEAN